MHTPVPWMLNTLGGKLSTIREIKSNVGEATKYYATITPNKEPPFDIVCRLDFGYGKPEDEANAEFIVRACNSHADLLEALELHMQWIGRPPTDPHSYDSLREEAWRKGKQAIEKAKE